MCDDCQRDRVKAAKTRQGAKANEAAHREWHAHAERASLAGPL